MASQQPLFRAQAREHYAQSREKAVLPRLVTPPVFLCLWILLGLLMLATVLAWQVQVPIYATASGAIIQQPKANQPTKNAPSVVLFVPASPAPTLHRGASLTVQVALTGASFTGSITSVEPGVLTPEQARQRYGLSGDLALLVAQPSVVVLVQLQLASQAPALVGLSLSAQVQVGSQSVLALLPHLLGELFGG